MIPRAAAPHLIELAGWYPAVVVTGPRQSGKTTLVREVFAAKPYVSLEDLDVRESASIDPRGFLALYPEGAVIDEAQHVPALFSYLQTRVDDDRRRGVANGRWVLTGSQHFGLIEAVAQSLAGRAGLLHLLPFALGELQAAGHPAARAGLAELLHRGLYPGVVTGDVPPAVWHADYAATYVERDLRQVVAVRDLGAFRTLLRMCAARIGQPLNLSTLAADCGVAVNTARAWISALEASFIVFLLPQHHLNYGKRLVKAPRLYFYDTGLAAWLAGIRSPEELALSSLRGPLFESWALAEAAKVRSHHRLDTVMHYWRDRSGLEVDLLLDDGRGLTPVEFKAGQTVAGDWPDALVRYRELASHSLPAGQPVRSPRLIYGGDEPRTRSGVDIRGWREWPTLAQDLMQPQ